MSEEHVIRVQQVKSAVTIKAMGGVPGPRGPAGVVLQSTPPDDHTVLWADTSN